MITSRTKSFLAVSLSLTTICLMILSLAACSYVPTTKQLRPQVYSQDTTTIPTCVIGNGSGTLVDRNQYYGLLVTNDHVVNGRQEIYPVKFENGQKFQARRIATDPANDLASLIIYRPDVVPARVGTFVNDGGTYRIAVYGPQRSLCKIEGKIIRWELGVHSYPVAVINGQALDGDSGGGCYDLRGDFVGAVFARCPGEAWVTVGLPIKEHLRGLVASGAWQPSACLQQSLAAAPPSERYQLCSINNASSELCFLGGKLRGRRQGKGGEGGCFGGQCPPQNRDSVPQGVNPFTPVSDQAAGEEIVEIPIAGILLVAVIACAAGYVLTAGEDVQKALQGGR